MSKSVELDVTERFGVEKLDVNELIFCLREFYSYSSYSSSSGEQSVLYCKEQTSDWEIKLIYQKNQLRKVFARLGEAEIVKIESLIKRELQSTTVQSINRMFMFASMPVEGFFSVADQFQLYPPPSNAPKPSFLWAEHPFVCEFSAASSKVWSLNDFRRTVRFQEIGLLLNLLLDSGVRLPSNMARCVWVIKKTNKSPCNGEKYSSQLCQEGYIVKDFNRTTDKFSELRDWHPLEEAAPEVYYHQLGISPGHTLKVAIDTRELANKFLSLLKMDDRQKFLRALFWFYQSDERIASSVSIAYIALINAVETLLSDNPIEKGSKDQSILNKSKSKSFFEFIEEHVPARLQFEDGCERKSFYDIRSRLTHGDTLFSRDLESSLLLNPANALQWKVVYTASTLVRIALIEWLRKA